VAVTMLMMPMQLRLSPSLPWIAGTGICLVLCQYSRRIATCVADVGSSMIERLCYEILCQVCGIFLPEGTRDHKTFFEGWKRGKGKEARGGEEFEGIKHTDLGRGQECKEASSPTSMRVASERSNCTGADGQTR
jgi:hypothetical protein